VPAGGSALAGLSAPGIFGDGIAGGLGSGLKAPYIYRSGAARAAVRPGLSDRTKKRKQSC
jgi:hypothetical protein